MSDNSDAPEMPAAEPSPAADPRADRLDALLHQWVSDCLHNSPVSQVTEAFNHITTSALPELLRRLMSEV